MTNGAGYTVRSRLHSFLRSRWGWGIGFALLLALGAPRIARQVRACFCPPAVLKSGGYSFDLDLTMAFVDKFSKTGVLYDTTGFDPYGPTTTTMFKYPPPHMAFMMVMLPSRSRDTAPPSAPLVGGGKVPGPETRAERVAGRAEAGRVARLRAYAQARPLVILYLASLVAALSLVLAALRPGWKLGGLIILVFLNWQPHWESMEGPGIESLLLLLLVLSLVLLKAGRVSIGGIPIGFAGALKVYPWVIAFPFLLSRRGLRVFLGVLAGAVLAFAVATYFVPPRILLEYLTRILPRVGGGSGIRENLSALGNLSRLAYFLTERHLAPVILPLGIRELVRAFPPSPAILLTLALWLALCLPIGLLTIRAWRRTASGMPERNDLLRLGMSVSLVILVMPTAWSAYQTLLLVPLALGIALAPPPGRAKLTWGLLLYACGAGAWNVGTTCPLPVVIVRSLIPLALWLACLRLLDTKSPAPLWSGADIAGPCSSPGDPVRPAG
jgi:hypothetical protein